MDQYVSKEEVQFYDIVVDHWPGEINFYKALIKNQVPEGGSILEIGCGTGRVLINLVKPGISFWGLDYSPEMIEKAREKSNDLSNFRWTVGNMKDFHLGEKFDLIIIPGHSFHFMLTPEDQLSCLRCVKEHLAENGLFVLHLDHQKLDWLGKLASQKQKSFELVKTISLDNNDQTVKKYNAWEIEQGTQTVIATTAWEILDKNGKILNRYENAKKYLHCIFRFEMEHLFARAGFFVEDLFGDFDGNKLEDTSPEMIWITR